MRIWPHDYSLCYYVVSLLIMGRNVCLDCVALHFNSLWLQGDMLKLLSMENPNFPERLKTTATSVNQNYLLLRLIAFVHSGTSCGRKSVALRSLLFCEVLSIDTKSYICRLLYYTFLYWFRCRRNTKNWNDWQCINKHLT